MVEFDPIWEKDSYLYIRLDKLLSSENNLDRTAINYIDGVVSPLNLLNQYKKRLKLVPAHGLSILSGLVPVQEYQNDLAAYARFIRKDLSFSKSSEEIHDPFDVPNYSGVIDQYIYANGQVSDMKRLDGLSPYQFLDAIFHSGLREIESYNEIHMHELKRLMENLTSLTNDLDKKRLKYVAEFLNMVDIWISEEKNKSLPLIDYINWAYRKKFTSKWLQHLYTCRKGETQLKREALLKKWMKICGYVDRSDIKMDNAKIWLELQRKYPSDFKQPAYKESEHGGQEIADTPDKFFELAEWFRKDK